jgi:outer membrane protein TolC
MSVAAVAVLVLLIGGGPLDPSRAVPRAAPTLGPAEAVARALARHPEAGIARAGQRQAESLLAEAKAGLLPRLDLLGTANRFQEPVLVTPIHGFDAQGLPEFDRTLIQGDLRLDFTLWDGGVRRGSISRASAEAAAATTGVEEVAAALVARTLTGYLRVLSLDATLAAADRRIEAIEEERRRAEQLLAAGRAPEVDLLRARAAGAAARAARVRVASALDTAERDLARLIGAEGGTVAAALQPVVLADTRVPPRQALELALDSAPSVARARRALEAAEAAVSVARGGRRPRLSLVGDVKEYGSSQGDFEEEWNAGVQLAVPLFRGGALRERVIQAEAARDAAAERLRLARLDAAAGLDRALAALAEAGARDEELREAVARYAEVARVERLRLDTGAGVQADYLDAEAALLDARAGAVDARHSVVVARVEVARVIGELDLGWVERSLRAAAPGDEE